MKQSVFLLIIYSLGMTCAQAVHGGGILLQNVQSIVFTDGLYTTGSRTQSVPQLQCLNDSMPKRYQPHSVICQNQGLDTTGSVVWACTADLDSRVHFGHLSVGCEGYTNPNDPYVLVGSCGLEYDLLYATTPFDAGLIFGCVFLIIILLLVLNTQSYHQRRPSVGVDRMPWWHYNSYWGHPGWFWRRPYVNERSFQRPSTGFATTSNRPEYASSSTSNRPVHPAASSIFSGLSSVNAIAKTRNR